MVGHSGRGSPDSVTGNPVYGTVAFQDEFPMDIDGALRYDF
jgi:hypothetical protein